MGPELILIIGQLIDLQEEKLEHCKVLPCEKHQTVLLGMCQNEQISDYEKGLPCQNTIMYFVHMNKSQTMTNIN